MGMSVISRWIFPGRLKTKYIFVIANWITK